MRSIDLPICNPSPTRPYQFSEALHISRSSPVFATYLPVQPFEIHLRCNFENCSVTHSTEQINRKYQLKEFSISSMRSKVHKQQPSSFKSASAHIFIYFMISIIMMRFVQCSRPFGSTGTPNSLAETDMFTGEIAYQYELAPPGKPSEIQSDEMLSIQLQQIQLRASLKKSLESCSECDRKFMGRPLFHLYHEVPSGPNPITNLDPGTK